VVRTAVLCGLLREHTQRLLLAGCTQVQINHVEQDHRDLLSAYHGGVALKTALDNCSDVDTGFNDGWMLCQGRFEILRQLQAAWHPCSPTLPLSKRTSR